VENNSPVAKNVMGYFVEHKLYEYYLKTPFKGADGKTYKHLIHSVDIKHRDKSAEIDLIFYENRTADSPFIAMEIKSFPSVKNKIKELKHQLKWQISKFTSNRQIPSEYYLCVHIYNKRFMKDLETNLKQLKKLVESNLSPCKFHVIYVVIDLTKDKKNQKDFYSNPYQNFMDNKLEEKSIGYYII